MIWLWWEPDLCDSISMIQIVKTENWKWYRNVLNKSRKKQLDIWVKVWHLHSHFWRVRRTLACTSCIINLCVIISRHVPQAILFSSSASWMDLSRRCWKTFQETTWAIKWSKDVEMTYFLTSTLHHRKAITDTQGAFSFAPNPYSPMFTNNNNNSKVSCCQVRSRVSSIYISFMQHKHGGTKADICSEGLFAVRISEVISTLGFQNMSQYKQNLIPVNTLLS